MVAKDKGIGNIQYFVLKKKYKLSFKIKKKEL